MIRVLLADDSPTAREFLTQILQPEPDIEVVGAAENGLEAVKLVENLRPDLVIMDVNMPTMNGFQATKEIMIRVPTPTLILTGEFDVGDPVFAGNSFRAGALTAFPKLPGPDSPVFEDASRQFLDAVRQAASTKVNRHWRYAPVLFRNAGEGGVRAVGVTVSHRGAPGLGRLLGQLPIDFAAPILVVSHVGSGFGDGFVAWLDRQCDLTVKVARDGHELEPATVYVAPENLHFGVAAYANKAVVALSADPPARGFRPSASWLLASLGEVYGNSAVGLFLRGVPEDSMLGLCAISLAGGRVLAQKDDGPGGFKSPAEDICTGLADAVLSIDHIAAQLREVVHTPEGAEADRMVSEASPRNLALSDSHEVAQTPETDEEAPAAVVPDEVSPGGLQIASDTGGNTQSKTDDPRPPVLEAESADDLQTASDAAQIPEPAEEKPEAPAPAVDAAGGLRLAVGRSD